MIGHLARLQENDDLTRASRTNKAVKKKKRHFLVRALILRKFGKNYDASFMKLKKKSY